MKKVLVVKVYHYYFGLFKKEIKIQYKIINGKVVFERQLEKNEQVIISYKLDK